jgi:hypothetical protein
VSFLREEESSRKEEGEWRRKRKGRKRKEKEKEIKKYGNFSKMNYLKRQG